MKLSQFTVVVNDYPEKEQHLLYNTLSRALIQVDKNRARRATKTCRKTFRLSISGAQSSNRFGLRGFSFRKNLKRESSFSNTSTDPLTKKVGRSALRY